MRLNGTLTVTLARELRSADGKRTYPAGSTVSLAIAAGSDCRVWQGDRPPVLATYKELVGATLTPTAND